MTIPVPGTLEYGEEKTVTLINNYGLTVIEMLKTYLTSYDPVTGNGVYELPNGTLFYMDAEGNISRIEEGGTIADVGSYQFIYGDVVDEQGHVNNQVVRIDLGKGISINLKTARSKSRRTRPLKSS